MRENLTKATKRREWWLSCTIENLAEANQWAIPLAIGCPDQPADESLTRQLVGLIFVFSSQLLFGFLFDALTSLLFVVFFYHARSSGVFLFLFSQAENGKSGRVDGWAIGRLGESGSRSTASDEVKGKEEQNAEKVFLSLSLLRVRFLSWHISQPQATLSTRKHQDISIKKSTRVTAKSNIRIYAHTHRQRKSLIINWMTKFYFQVKRIFSLLCRSK